VLVGLSLLWMWRDALSTLVRDHGVRYLVVDQLHGGDPARVSGLDSPSSRTRLFPSSP
jgi:hypothetical protein